jgi:hypothetical protein
MDLRFAAQNHHKPPNKNKNVILSEASEFVAPGCWGATINSEASRMDLHFSIAPLRLLGAPSTKCSSP